MFPPNESVEILHSDKHDPIFRLIKESLSLPCLRRRFLVAVDRSFLPFRRHPLFSSYDFRLCPKRFPIKRTRYPRAYRRKSHLFETYGSRLILYKQETFRIAFNPNISCRECIFTIQEAATYHRILSLHANVLS